MPLKCPFCLIKNKEKEYQTPTNLVKHILISHDTGFKVSVLISVIGIIIAVAGVLIGVYSDDIKYQLNKKLGEDPKIYVAVSTYYTIKTNSTNTQLNETDKQYLIQKQKELGIIPQGANKDPLLFRIEDNCQIMGCQYFAFENVQETKVLDGQEYHSFRFQIPAGDFLQILSNCDDCLGYLFYSINTGKNKIEELNIKVCLENNSQIIYSSKDVVQESGNCFRLLAETIDKEEQNLGYVIVKNSQKPDSDDFWGENIFTLFEGDVRHLSKKAGIYRNQTVRMVNVFVPGVNC
jgi:hypothetical protein